MRRAIRRRASLSRLLSPLNSHGELAVAKLAKPVLPAQSVAYAYWRDGMMNRTTAKEQEPWKSSEG
jgi:hypothetical protein